MTRYYSTLSPVTIFLDLGMSFLEQPSSSAEAKRKRPESRECRGYRGSPSWGHDDIQEALSQHHQEDDGEEDWPAYAEWMAVRMVN